MGYLAKFDPETMRMLGYVGLTRYSGPLCGATMHTAKFPRPRVRKRTPAYALRMHGARTVLTRIHPGEHCGADRERTASGAHR